VTAFNWSAGPQVVIWLIVLIVVFSGVVSHEVATIINIAALVVILLYHLFILRTTLKLSLFVSIGLVAGEAMLTQFIELIRVSMMR